MAMETTTIRIDRDTKVRLEDLAADVPLARYLRDLSIKLTGVPTGEDRLSRIEGKLDKIADILRQRNEPTVEDVEAIIETKELGDRAIQSEGRSVEKRTKFLDFMLSKAELSTIKKFRDMYRDMNDHPEHNRAYQEQQWIKEMAVQIQTTPEAWGNLWDKIKQWSPEHKQMFLLTFGMKGDPDKRFSIMKKALEMTPEQLREAFGKIIKDLDNAA